MLYIWVHSQSTHWIVLQKQGSWHCSRHKSILFNLVVTSDLLIGLDFGQKKASPTHCGHLTFISINYICYCISNFSGKELWSTFVSLGEMPMSSKSDQITLLMLNLTDNNLGCYLSENYFENRFSGHLKLQMQLSQQAANLVFKHHNTWPDVTLHKKKNPQLSFTQSDMQILNLGEKKSWGITIGSVCCVQVCSHLHFVWCSAPMVMPGNRSSLWS